MTRQRASSPVYRLSRLVYRLQQLLPSDAQRKSVRPGLTAAVAGKMSSSEVGYRIFLQEDVSKHVQAGVSSQDS